MSHPLHLDWANYHMHPEKRVYMRMLNVGSGVSDNQIRIHMFIYMLRRICIERDRMKGTNCVHTFYS